MDTPSRVRRSSPSESQRHGFPDHATFPVDGRVDGLDQSISTYGVEKRKCQFSPLEKCGPNANNEKTESLPSLREFCSGRLPSSGSTLDIRIRDLGVDKPLPPPRSLAVLSCPNATFAWPNLLLASQMSGDTYMMMDVRPSSSSSPKRSCSLKQRQSAGHHYLPSSRSSSPGSVSTSSGETPDYQKAREYRRRISISSDSDDYDIGHQRRRSSSFKRAPMAQSSRSALRASTRHQPYESDSEMLPLDSMSERSLAAHRHPRSRMYSVDSLSDTFSDYADSSEPRKEPLEPLLDLNWEDYVEKAGRLNGVGPIMYTCRWRKGQETTCNYTGKKQLAKRHVESVHLAKKPHVCGQCNKPFPQKTSLDIHIRSVHTFDKPLKCEHCPACFSDPARRHKHYRVEHPEKVVKRPRMKLDLDEIKHLLVK